MNINQIYDQLNQPQIAIIVAVLILLAMVYVYVEDIRREKDQQAWEEYKHQVALRERGIDGLGNREKEPGS